MTRPATEAAYLHPWRCGSENCQGPIAELVDALSLAGRWSSGDSAPYGHRLRVKSGPRFRGLLV